MIARTFASRFARSLARPASLLPIGLLLALAFSACATADDPVDSADAGGPPSSVPEAAAPDGGSVEGGTCGNAKLDIGEACDDGNTESGDGCSSSCQREPSGPNDVCNGSEITLELDGSGGERGNVSDTTASLHGYYEGSCGGAGGDDAVYQVTPSITGVLTATVSMATFDSVVYARSTCEQAGSQLACDDYSGSGGKDVITVAVEKGKPVFLFVDGAAGSGGSFMLHVAVKPASCGDGIVQPPEACDDGNTLSGDGCSATCTFEGSGIVNTCPGQSIALVGAGTSPRHIAIAGDTTPFTNTLSATGCIAFGNNAVYQVRSDIDGKLTAKLVASYPEPVLVARADCSKADIAASGSQLGCAERVGLPASNTPVELSVPVKAGIPVFLSVDANKNTQSGPFTLDLTVVPAVCGNDIVEGSESCDDGNTRSGDGCSATCTLEAPPADNDACPGTAITLTPNAASDRFTASVTASTSALTGTYSGACAFASSQAPDAVYMVEAPIAGRLEATVHADFSATIYARNNCASAPESACSAKYAWTTPETIGIPVTQGQKVYLFVDGKLAGASGTFTLHTTITAAACGNGVVDAGEQCDDGNTLAGDGCSPGCQTETALYDTCASPGSIALTASAPGTWTADVYGGTTNLTHNQTFLPFAGCPSNGKDAIYTLTAPVDGVASVTVSSSFAVTLGVRTNGTCPANLNATYPLACTSTLATVPANLLFPVVKDAVYYVIVDSPQLTDQGPFTMNVSVATPKCGDGVTSGSETCDDGNTTSGDGCSATCALESLTGIGSCPGYAAPMKPVGNGYAALVTVDTTSLASTYSGKCGGSGNEGIVAITAPISGKLTAKLRGLGTLHVRSDCGVPATEVACKSDVPPAVTPSRDVVLNVESGSTYYFFLDGYAGSSGLGTLDVTVTP